MCKKVINSAIAAMISIFSLSSGAWTIEATMEGKPVGQQCGWSDGALALVSNDRAFGGVNSCKIAIESGDTGFGSWGGIFHNPTNVGRYGELWFRIRTYFPVGFDYNSYSEGNRLKFLRIHTRSPTVENFGYDDLYINPTTSSSNTPFSFIYEGEQVWSHVGSRPDDSIVLGSWETYEMYVKFDTVPRAKGGQAHVRIWKNGKLLKNIEDRVTLKTVDGYSERVHLYTYWNGGSPKSQSMYVDDLVITTDTPAARDASGFPFIGVGGHAAAPNPPTQVIVE